MSLFFLAFLIILFYYYKYITKLMFLNPFSPLAFIKIKSLKVTSFILLSLLIKTNLLRLKGGLIGGLFALILISGIFASTSIAVGSLIYAYRVKRKSALDNENESAQNLETVNI